MGFFKFFRRDDNSSARVAKDRLQVLIAHERSGRDGPDYLPMLRQDILNVIKKYVAVDDEALKVQVESQDDCDVLELNITLPEGPVERPLISRTGLTARSGDPDPARAGSTPSGPRTMPSEEAKRRAAARRQGQTAG